MDPHSPDTLSHRLLDAVIQGDLKKSTHISIRARI